MKGRLLSRRPPCGGDLRWLPPACAALLVAGCAVVGLTRLDGRVSPALYLAF